MYYLNFDLVMTADAHSHLSQRHMRWTLLHYL